MEILRRFGDKYLALDIGRKLDYRFTRETLTGLNFFVESDRSVVIIACFDHGLSGSQKMLAELIMDPGEELTPATAEEYLDQLSGGIVGFLGEGLGAFETWVKDGSLWLR